MYFTAVKESMQKTFLVLRIIQIKKTVHLQQLKGIQSSKIGKVKGVPFVNRRNTKGVPFLSKRYIKW